MSTYPPDQVQELKQFCDKLKSFPEGGVTYFLMEGTNLPDGCSPAKCDVVFRPIDSGDGYMSRLYFDVVVKCPYARNWNVTNARLAERNWHAFSWKVNVTNFTLAQLVREHLSALVRTV